LDIIYNRWLRVKHLAWVEWDTYKLIKIELTFFGHFVKVCDLKYQNIICEIKLYKKYLPYLFCLVGNIKSVSELNRKSLSKRITVKLWVRHTL